MPEGLSFLFLLLQLSEVGFGDKSSLKRAGTVRSKDAITAWIRVVPLVREEVISIMML